MRHALQITIERALHARCGASAVTLDVAVLAHDIHPEYADALLPQVINVLADLAASGRLQIRREGRDLAAEDIAGTVEICWLDTGVDTGKGGSPAR